MRNSNLPSRSESRRNMDIVEPTQVLLGMEVDTTSIQRLVHAAEQISLLRNQYPTEYMVIGSHLADIHLTLDDAINKRLDNPIDPGAHAGRLFNDYASKVLKMNESTATLWLHAYHGFSDRYLRQSPT